VANALQLEAARRRAKYLVCFGQICTAHAHKLLFPGFRSKV